MKHFNLLFLFVVLSFCTVSGQKRSVTVIENNVMFNYTITRYVPVWEIQSGKNEQEGLLSQHKQFFKEATNTGLQSLKNLLYSKALVPDDVKRMDAKAMESYLASNRLVIHYRIQYKEHSIFLAHLNNSPVRSVIPFRIEGSKWILDPEFANTEFYALLSNLEFDPYMGLKEGVVVCSFGFEEVVDMERFYDYSGNRNNLAIKSATIIDGRFGGALKLNGAEVGTASLKNNMPSKDRFKVDFHFQIPKMVYNTEKIRGVVSLVGSNESALKVEVVGTKLRLSYPAIAGVQRLEWNYTPESWAHITVEINSKGVSVRVDDTVVSSSSVLSTLSLEGGKVQIGAANGVKANMDEFRIIK
jgi:hypothetical protein